MLSTVRLLTLNCSLALLYLLSSIIALEIAFPPSNASPVWPGAGITLAFFLVYKKQIVPGIVLGIFAGQLYSYFNSTSLQTLIDSFVFACVFSLGSFLQVYCASLLVNHFKLQQDPLINDRKIILFLMLIGPVSCIIAASVGTSFMLYKEIIHHQEFILSWLIWWAGDTIGVIIFAPLCFIFISPQATWIKRRRVISYPLIILLIAISVIFQFSIHQQETQIKNDFSRQTQLLHSAIEHQIQEEFHIIAILESYFHSSITVTRENFYLFTKPLLNNHNFTQALEWIPKTMFNKEITKTFTKSKKLIVSDTTPLYETAYSCNNAYPITYQQPYNNNNNALGLDICNSPEDLNALQLARDTGSITVTNPISFFLGTYREGNMVFYAPIYRSDQHRTTKEAKQAAFQGLVANVFSLHQLVTEIKKQLPISQLGLKINNAATLLYDDLEVISTHNLGLPTLQFIVNTQIANQIWTFTYQPYSTFFTSHQSWLIWWILFTGVFLTSLTTMGLLMLTGRTLHTQELVRIRTRELRNTNQKLSDSEHQFRELVQAQSAIVWRVNPETFAFTFVSDEAEKILGYPISAWIEDKEFWIKHLHEDDKEWAPAFCMQSTRQQQSHEFEYRMYAKNGQIIWLRDVVNVIIENGVVKELIGFMLDITEQKNSQNKLQLSESKYRTLFENDMDALLILDLTTQRFVEANAKALNLFSTTEEDIKQIGFAELSPSFQPSGINSAKAAQYYISQASANKPTTFEWLYSNKFGEDLLCAVSLIQMPSLGQKLVKASIRDITEQKHMEDQLRLAATTFETHEGIVITDKDSVILRVNNAFTDITGYSAEDVIGQTPRILKSGRHDQSFYQNIWLQLSRHGKFEGEIWNRRKNGEIFPEWQTITAVKNKYAQITHYVAIFSDITEKKRHENEIYELAYYDSLTNLPNRRLFLNQLSKETKAAKRDGQFGAIIFLDLDRFKVLNDSLGHHSGDLLLIQVAKRLKQTIRKEDTPSRLSGDEFVIMLKADKATPLRASKQARIVAEKIRTILNKPFSIQNHEHHCSASIGVTIFPDQESNPIEILQQADKAMYHAKSLGRNSISIYHHRMKKAADARLFLEKELHRAIYQQDFILYYQPQVEKNGLTQCVEALIRWKHSDKGLISPAHFIPVAEETGLIIQLGAWVINEACRQMRAWLDDGIHYSHISVNVSSKQFRKEDFVSQIKATLNTYQLQASHLLIELTEGIVIDNIEDTIQKMNALKSLGVKISIDDFGTGYSSLTYLKQLPLDQLKIDRSFINDICTDNNDATIVETIIAMAHNLGLNVIAEGVENQQQLNFLCEKGCTFFQGYYFSQPLSAEELIEFDQNESKAL